jgi:hypothetical protein
MEKMKDNELSAIVDILVKDSVSYNSEFMRDNEEYLKRYNREPYGDEEEGFSKVIASDVRDTVDSDMTSMVRVFLGSGDVVEFQALSDDEEELLEAQEKTSLINHLVLRRPDSYKTIHCFLKDAEIQKMGVVHYYADTIRKTKELYKKNLTVPQVTVLINGIKKEKDVERVDIVEKEKLEDDGKFNFRIRITTSKKELVIDNIPTEYFLLTKGSSTIDDATAVGHQSFPTRGELVASGMSEEEVNKFPYASASVGGLTGNQQQTGTNQAADMRAIRWRDEGGDIVDTKAFTTWSNETVSRVLLFANIDFDGDGISERRRIVKIGQKITENEPYDHVPYALTSCILEPHKAIGNGRASLVVQDQSVNTELDRATLDNIYDVGNPRAILGNGVDHDDYYDSKKSGVVRMKSNATQSPADSVYPLTTPFVGQEILLVKQSREQAKANRTGTLLDSQGLDADQLHKETATRFDGVEKAREAKIELVARNHGEIGFRKLFDGVAWTLNRFIDTDIKVRLRSGKAISVNPSEWKYDCVAVSMVGLGAVNGEQAVQKYAGLLAVQQELKASGSLLVDDQKIYNTLNKMSQALGESTVSDYFNNPKAPLEMIFAQYQQLLMMVEQAQMQIQELSQTNPLAEAETIKAQASLIKAQGQEQIALIEAEAKKEIEQLKLVQQKAFHDSNKTFEYTKLEVENGVDVNGVGLNTV